MTQLYLIALLCVYAGIIAFSFLTGGFAPAPAEISKAKSVSEEIFKRKIKSYPIAVICLNVINIGFGAVGFIGMFFLWHFAPYFFAAHILCKVFMAPYLTMFWEVKNGWEMLFAHIECILDGVILTLVFFGPARHLFF